MVHSFVQREFRWNVANNLCMHCRGDKGKKQRIRGVTADTRGAGGRPPRQKQLGYVWQITRRASATEAAERTVVRKIDEELLEFCVDIGSRILSHFGVSKHAHWLGMPLHNRHHEANEQNRQQTFGNKVRLQTKKNVKRRSGVVYRCADLVQWCNFAAPNAPRRSLRTSTRTRSTRCCAQHDLVLVQLSRGWSQLIPGAEKDEE